MPRRWQVLAGIATVSCFTSGWFLQRKLAAVGDVYQQARLFENVMAHVRDYHLDSIAEPELYRKASDGLLAQLHDPYAALLVGKDLEQHVERTTGVPGAVLTDTLTTSEAGFAQSLGGQMSVFRDVLTAYALELRQGRAVASEQFQVTAAMRVEVQRRLRDRGVAIADRVFGGATRLVDEQPRAPRVH
jgi:hypothetical protein